MLVGYLGPKGSFTHDVATHTAQCYQTEAVVRRMVVITDGRNTDT